MKKSLLFLLSISFSLALFTGLFGLNKNIVDANETSTPQPTQIDVETFLPSSPIEFYDLKCPIAVNYSDDGYLIISEYYKNQETKETYNRITVYNPTTKTYSVIPNHPTISSISQIQKFGDFIYYVSSSNIYYLPISNLNATPTLVRNEVGDPVIVANYFSFYNGKVLTNTNNFSVIYEIVINSNVPQFNKLYSFESFSTKGVFSNDGNIFLIEEGLLKYFNASNKTLITLTTINKDIIDMVNLGDYIYFTAIDGLYKIKKETNSTIETVITIDQTKKTLGYINSPKGIAVKGNNLLICDDVLNTIQEVDVTNNKFTTFAITTESTADYRLTKNASNLELSDNYIYALDNAETITESEKPKKRIVKISLGDTKTYSKIDLASLYEAKPNLEIKFFTASDTHVLIYDGDFLTLYKQTDGSPILLEKVTEIQSSSITSACYLDGAFYYSDTARPDYVKDVINVYKLLLPNEDNNLKEVTIKSLTKDAPQIEGISKDFTVDIFGNVLIVYTKTETDASNYLIRLYNGTITEPISIQNDVNSIQTDFAGNVYLLTKTNNVIKYTANDNSYTTSNYQIKTSYNDNVKNFALDYHSTLSYYIGDACIYKNTNNALSITSLLRISANNLNEKEIIKDVKFVTIHEDAKIFKVKLNDYVLDGNNKYFNNLVPINSPNTIKVYTVISEIDSNYYLVSYSDKLVALVRKTSVTIGTGTKLDATIILEENYNDYGIQLTNLNSKELFITNDVTLYSKPIIDENYLLNSLEKNKKVYAIKEVSFNDNKMTLISLEKDGEPIGYVVSGYLKTSIIEPTTMTSEEIVTIGEGAQKQTTTILMLLLIAFTVSVSLILIEAKLLFKEDK